MSEFDSSVVPSLPPGAIHQPWALGRETLDRLGCPAPLGDHREAVAAYVGSRRFHAAQA